MKIAVDIAPIKTESLHKFRGSGSYINLLYNHLGEFDKKNSYLFFNKKLDKKVDLVHYPYFDPFFLTLPFIKKTKSIVTIHDLIPIIFPERFPAGIRGKLKWLVQSAIVKQMDAVITDSEASRRDIIRILGINPEKIFKIYLCVDKTFKIINDRELKNKIIKKYNLPSKFVLYVGDVTWNKNLPRLVGAIRKTKIPLVLIGKALINKQIKLNEWNKDLIDFQKEIEKDTRFIRLGFVPGEDLVVIYNLATALVMPSLYEGFGLPVLEAMSCGCPVITSEEGSLPEIAGEAAFYVKAEDINSISDGIIEVFNNGDLELKLRQKSLLQAKKFSCEKTLKKTVEVYEKVYES